MTARIIPPARALEAICAATGLRDGWAPVEFRRDGRTAMSWHHLGVPWGPELAARSILRREELYSDEVILGLPQRKRWNGGVAGASVLWAYVAGSDQERRARGFRPLPSIVVQEGSSSRRWLIWRLEEWIDYFAVAAANRKLAYFLHATQKHGDPDGFAVPAPGTFLRVGRSRPVAARCSRLTDATYTVAQVVGRLKEPPALEPWYERASAR